MECSLFLGIRTEMKYQMIIRLHLNLTLDFRFQVYILIALPWTIASTYFTVLLILLKTGGESSRCDVTHAIYISFDIIAFVGFITLVASNLVIYKQAQCQLTHMRRTSVAQCSTRKLNEKTFDLKERRLAFINIGLVAKFVVFWMPTLVTMNYHLLWESSTAAGVEYLSFHLVLANCLCDPTVYVCLSHDIRVSVQRFIFGKRVEEDSPELNRTLACDTEELCP